MRLIVFNCLLLASFAVASPNGRLKRDLAYLKNLITSAIFGKSQINIQPAPVLLEENGFNPLQLPGYNDVMINVAPKTPVVEEFVYPPSVEKVNLNAFGTVVGTKSKDETLVAVNEVNNLLSTGILYGGQNNLMKEAVVPMFSSYTPNYVVEEKIKTAPVIKRRPVLTEAIETRPFLTEVVETRPFLTEAVKTRPFLTEAVETRPFLTEAVETRPFLTKAVETRPFLTEAVETRPFLTKAVETRPFLTEAVESRPYLTEAVETRPFLTEAVETRPFLTEAVETRPFLTEAVETRPFLTQAVETRPFLTEAVETRPFLTEAVETRPFLTKAVETRPFLTEAVETRPFLTKAVETRPFLTEAVETRPFLTKAVETRPFFTEVIRPVEEKVELIESFEPKYSYKQIQNNEPVVMYTAYNYPGVELVETVKTKPELPMCIKKRVDEAIVLGADANRFAPVQEVFQYQTPSFVDFSYPRIEANAYVQNSFLEGLTKESDIINGFQLTSQRLRPSKDSPVRYNLTPTQTKAINPRPNALHSRKPPHFEEDISASKDKVQAINNLGEKDDTAKTLGEYIATHVNIVGRNSVPNRNTKQIKDVPIAGSKDNVSNAKIPINVNKLQRNLNTGKVVKESDALRTNVKTNANQYVNEPAVNSGTANKDNAQVRNVLYSNKVTESPQSPARTNAPQQPLRENIQTSIIDKPTDVKNNNNNPQKNADGSSLNGNKHGVSVSVKEGNNRGRGDIPDQ